MILIKSFAVDNRGHFLHCNDLHFLMFLNLFEGMVQYVTICICHNVVINFSIWTISIFIIQLNISMILNIISIQWFSFDVTTSSGDVTTSSGNEGLKSFVFEKRHWNWQDLNPGLTHDNDAANPPATTAEIFHYIVK